MLGLGTSAIATHTKLWHPTDVTSLEMWLVARQEYMGLDGVDVESWIAKYGSYTYAQATANQRPRWNSGSQSISFVEDGVGTEDDHLQEASNPIVLDTSATGWTVAIYAAATNWDNGDQVFMGDAGGNNDFFYHEDSANEISIKVDGQTRTVALDSALTDAQHYHIMVTVATDGDILLYIDGVQQADTSQSFNNAKDFEIDQISGKNGPYKTFTGHIKSIMVFREPLGAEDRTGCYEHMTQR